MQLCAVWIKFTLVLIMAATIYDVLEEIRQNSTSERDKGDKFEKAISLKIQKHKKNKYETKYNNKQSWKYKKQSGQKHYTKH